MKTTIATCLVSVMLMLTLQNCNDCEKELADLVFNKIRSNKQANPDGEVEIKLNDVVEFTSEVLNSFVHGKCKDETPAAAQSQLKAVLNILDAAGNVIGTLDTLYQTDALNAGAIDDVLTKVKFKEEGYYELDFGLDATQVVPERNENNWIDVFESVWHLAQILLSKKESDTIMKTTNGVAIKVGDGQTNQAKLNDAIARRDFHAFAQFY